MKNFKKIAFGLFVGALAFGFSSFTTAHAKRSGTQYVFNGNSLSDDKTASIYSVESGDPGCDETAELPCVITVPAGTTLSSWLSARTNTQILQQADDTKSVH